MKIILLMLVSIAAVAASEKNYCQNGPRAANAPFA